MYNRPVCVMLCALALALPCATAQAQAYPTKPIRIVTSEVGGTADSIARLVAQGLTAGLGQQAIVDNRGSGVIPGEIVARARPDGYTLLSFAGTFWLQPLLRKKVPYDPVSDFAPITTTVSLPTLLVVHPSVAATSVKELIALAKAKPGELNCGSGAVGSPNHLAAALFKSMTGVNMVTINFRGTGPAVLGLLSGQVQLMFSNGVAVMPHVNAGKLRALGVASAKPSPLTPGVPAIAESGVPGYESSIMSGFWAPAGTPPAIVERLNRETVRFLNTAEVRDRLFKLGAEPAGSTPAELGAFVKADLAKWARVTKEAGIRAE